MLYYIIRMAPKKDNIYCTRRDFPTEAKFQEKNYGCEGYNNVLMNRFITKLQNYKITKLQNYKITK